MRKWWATFWSVVALAWLATATLALVNREHLLSIAGGNAILTVLFAPIGVLLVLGAAALAEGGALLAMVAAFKFVTLWQIPTGYTNPDVQFPWYGFARSSAGQLLASQSAALAIGAAVYVLLGLAAWLLLQ